MLSEAIFLVNCYRAAMYTILHTGILEVLISYDFNSLTYVISSTILSELFG